MSVYLPMSSGVHPVLSFKLVQRQNIATLPQLHHFRKVVAHASRLQPPAADGSFNADDIPALNQVSNAVLRVMLDNSEAEATAVSADLEQLRKQMVQKQEQEAAAYVVVLQGMMRHIIARDRAQDLEGPFAHALNQMLNQAAGSGWELRDPGEGDGRPGSMGPQWSSWEDVAAGRNPNAHLHDGSGNAATGGIDIGGGGGGALRDVSLYHELDVHPAASAADIKSAFRKRALQLHPDVNDAPDAAAQFQRLAEAYEVLSNASSRQLYDRHGLDYLNQLQGCGSLRSKADREWQEFKPVRKDNKHTRARAAASSWFAGRMGMGAAAEVGQIVEYPLTDAERRELQDGRERGVGLLVSRNQDRADAGKLPEHKLQLCEIEPLRQKERGSCLWVPDELAPPIFCAVQDLWPVAAQDYDRRFDVWLLDATLLSKGCAGPELGDEIIL